MIFVVVVVVVMLPAALHHVHSLEVRRDILLHEIEMRRDAVVLVLLFPVRHKLGLVSVPILLAAADRAIPDHAILAIGSVRPALAGLATLPRTP